MTRWYVPRRLKEKVCGYPRSMADHYEEVPRTITERYLALLRGDLQNLPPPHLYHTDPQYTMEDLEKFYNGVKRIPGAMTMIGEKRLRQLDVCIRELVADGISGDIVEAGCWFGGACLYMRAVLDVLNVRHKTIYACDSFDYGFPEPDGRFPQDNGTTIHKRWNLPASKRMVVQYFKNYGYDDNRTQFIEGFFKDTLPTLPVRELCLLRIDADVYTSTWDALMGLYDKVAPGGYVIVDDYGTIRHTHEAVNDYRARCGIKEPIKMWDLCAGFWRKER